MLFPRLAACGLLALASTPLANGQDSAQQVDRQAHKPLPIKAMVQVVTIDMARDGQESILIVHPLYHPQLLQRQLDGSLMDITAATGIHLGEPVTGALWCDVTLDGYRDLILGTRSGVRVLENRGTHRFIETTEQLGMQPQHPVLGLRMKEEPVGGQRTLQADYGSEFGTREYDPELRTWLPPSGSSAAISPAPSSGSTPTASPFTSQDLLLIATAIRDQAGGAPIQASRTPELGMLFPLSAEFFIAQNGNIGVGTTAPSQRLSVAGSATIAGNLTIAGDLITTPTPSHVSINPSAFDPQDSFYQFDRLPLGSPGLSGTSPGNTMRFYADAQLEHGAELSTLTLNCYDDSSDNVTLSLHRVPDNGDAWVQLAAVSSSGASASWRTFSTPLAETVDNQQYSYLLRATWEVPSTYHRIRLGRVRISFAK